jgi:hypothetical protein
LQHVHFSLSASRWPAAVPSGHADEVKLLSALVMKPALTELRHVRAHDRHKLTAAAWWQKVA